MATENVTLKVGDGTSMQAYVAYPDTSGPHPGVIVLQEAFGVNPHIRDVTGRFASEGYVAIAPELFHRTAPGFQGDYKDFPAAMKHLQAVTNEGAEADLRAAFEWLQSRSDVKNGGVFSVGFCMGGRISFLANSFLPLRAAASFYGGGIAQQLLDRTAKLNGPMLLVWGGLNHP